MVAKIPTENTPLFRLCRNKSQIKIMSVYLNNPYGSYNQTDIEQLTDLSRQSVNEHFPSVTDSGIIEPVSTYEYQLNKSHPLALPLYVLFHFDYGTAHTGSRTNQNSK